MWLYWIRLVLWLNAWLAEDNAQFDRVTGRKKVHAGWFAPPWKLLCCRSFTGSGRSLLSRIVSELFYCCFELYVILNCSMGEMCNQAISFVSAMHTHCLLSYWTRAKHSKFTCLGHVKMTKNKICMQLWQKQYYWLWLVKSKGYVKLLGYFFNRYLLCSGLRDFADNKLYVIIF